MTHGNAEFKTSVESKVIPISEREGEEGEEGRRGGEAEAIVAAGRKGKR